MKGNKKGSKEGRKEGALWHKNTGWMWLIVHRHGADTEQKKTRGTQRIAFIKYVRLAWSRSCPPANSRSGSFFMRTLWRLQSLQGGAAVEGKLFVFIKVGMAIIWAVVKLQYPPTSQQNISKKMSSNISLPILYIVCLHVCSFRSG